jgi:hypothetical protein
MWYSLSVLLVANYIQTCVVHSSGVIRALSNVYRTGDFTLHQCARELRDRSTESRRNFFRELRYARYVHLWCDKNVTRSKR